MVEDEENASNASSSLNASSGKAEHAESASSSSKVQAHSKDAKSKNDKSKKPSKNKKKKFVTLGVVVVIIIVAGIGFGVWHNQPSFCNSICHSPMDNYVNGYYNGNSSESAGAYAHQIKNVTCLQCHEAKLDEQISEACAWVKGSYKTDSKGSLKKTLVTADKKTCVKSGCHNWDDVVSATENWGGNSGVNPHRSHQGEAIDCSNCHGMHTQSMMYCNTCHDFKVPDGWATPTKTSSSASTTSSTSTSSGASTSSTTQSAQSN